jgi:predicted Zn finger-like uncharacterized protein
MYTVCSKCNLNLAVTVADLRAAHGYVRCGRCHNVFNALTALSDELPGPAEPPQPPRPVRAGARTPAPQAEQPVGYSPAHSTPRAAHNSQVLPPAAADREAARALARQQVEASNVVPAALRPREAPRSEPEASLEFDPIGTDVSRIFVEAIPDESTGTFETITLIGDESDESGERREGALEPGDAQPEKATTSEPAAAAAGVPAGTRAEAPAEAAAPLGTGDGPAMPPLEPEAALAALSHPAAVLSRGTRALLYLAALVLALVLGAQIVHHYRSDLAGYEPLSRPLTALYATLGMPLEPRWDVTAYDVRQLGAEDSTATGRLSVRASLSNTAARPQPLPLLRVTVQDRFGNRLAARDVKPDEYLPHPVSLMAAGQRVDTQVTFADPGPQVAGFEIDACLRLASGRTICANDPAR